MIKVTDSYITEEGTVVVMMDGNTDTPVEDFDGYAVTVATDYIGHENVPHGYAGIVSYDDYSDRFAVSFHPRPGHE